MLSRFLVRNHRSRPSTPSRVATLMLLLCISVTSAIANAATAPAPLPFPVANYINTLGSQISTASLKGRPSMLWLLSTWCGSCAAGLQSMNAQAEQIRASGLQLVILQTYRNEGGEGPNVTEFVAKWAPTLSHVDNVTIGEATSGLEAAYNPRHYPDIYYLIDAQGRIQSSDTAPSVTMEKILDFAHQQRGHSQP